MKLSIAELHVRALPHTWSSRMGVSFVSLLYKIVRRFGFVHTISREGKLVGVISGVGAWILTLVVAPSWQHKGIGRALIAQVPGRRYVYTQAYALGFYQKMGFSEIFRLGEIIFLCRK